MRIRAHAPVPRGRKRGQFRFQAALHIEQLLGPVASQPCFQQSQVPGMGGGMERDLVRSEAALNLESIDDPRPGPALG
ncbi:hypothetical protein D3C83_84580 [compost metagenome]